MGTIDFIRARPAPDWITKGPPHIVATALALPGEGHIAYLADDREVTDANSGYPISGSVSVAIPSGNFQARFYAPTTGASSPAIAIRGSDKPVSIELPPFEHDIVLEVRRVP